MVKIPDQTLEEQIKNRQKHDKASVVFLKLYPKHLNIKSWDSIRAQSYPITELRPRSNNTDPV